MPKEMIRSPQNKSEPRSSDDHTPLVGLGVQVSWGRDSSHVQIATGSVPATGFESGCYVDVGRYQINALIRLLRKARDQAFGADA